MFECVCGRCACVFVEIVSARYIVIDLGGGQRVHTPLLGTCRAQCPSVPCLPPLSVTLCHSLLLIPSLPLTLARPPWLSLTHPLSHSSSPHRQSHFYTLTLSLFIIPHLDILECFIQQVLAVTDQPVGKTLVGTTTTICSCIRLPHIPGGA